MGEKNEIDLDVTEVVSETIVPTTPFSNEEVVELPLHNIGLVETDDDDDEENASIDDITKINSEYNNSNLNKADVFVDEAGNIIDPSKLTILERLKITAKQIGQTLDDPDPKCKKCYGRGYTGVNIDGNLPLPCNCLYKTFFKENPGYKSTQMPSWNRSMKRKYQKDMQKYVTLQAKSGRERYEKMEKSKANLGKFTPGFVKKEDTVIDFADMNIEEMKEESLTNE